MLDFKDFIEAKTKEKPLEEAGLVYSKTSGAVTIKTKITIPIEATIQVSTYTDRKTGETSGSKSFKISYTNESKMQEAIDDQIVAVVKKAVPGEDVQKLKGGRSSHALMGFLNFVCNKQYQQEL